MKVYKGIFKKPQYEEGLDHMDNKECIVICCSSGRDIYIVDSEEGSEFPSTYVSGKYSVFLLKLGYIEVDCFVKEELTSSGVETEAPIKGISKLFGQELKSLQVEFK